MGGLNLLAQYKEELIKRAAKKKDSIYQRERRRQIEIYLIGLITKSETEFQRRRKMSNSAVRSREFNLSEEILPVHQLGESFGQEELQQNGNKEETNNALHLKSVNCIANGLVHSADLKFQDQFSLSPENEDKQYKSMVEPTFENQGVGLKERNRHHNSYEELSNHKQGISGDYEKNEFQAISEDFGEEQNARIYDRFQLNNEIRDCNENDLVRNQDESNIQRHKSLYMEMNEDYHIALDLSQSNQDEARHDNGQTFKRQDLYLAEEEEEDDEDRMDDEEKCQMNGLDDFEKIHLKENHIPHDIIDSQQCQNRQLGLQELQEDTVMRGREESMIEEIEEEDNGQEVKIKKKKKKEKPVGKDYRFSKLANCHMCKRKNKIVYGCYKNWIPTSCNKFFCVDCLLNGLKENILLIIQKEDTWKCPYKKDTCQCRHCLNKKEDFQIPLIEDENEISKLFGEAPSQQNQKKSKTNEDAFIIRMNIKNKMKKLIDFNGQLIQKMNKLQSQLTKEEIMFYNKLIHDNLHVLDNLANTLADKEKIKEEEGNGKFHYY